VLQDYQKAISLALAMEQPGRLYSLLRDVRNTTTEADAEAGVTPSVTGHSAVDEVIRIMSSAELSKLLSYLRDWNARAKTSVVAQDILFAIVKLRSAEDIMAAFRSPVFLDSDGVTSHPDATTTTLKELVDALIPYTERHLSRMDKLVQESYVVDYLLSEMDTILGDLDELDVNLKSVGLEDGDAGDSEDSMDVDNI
jgi:U3 small nucleolar RNA-associated protein 13